MKKLTYEYVKNENDLKTDYCCPKHSNKKLTYKFVKEEFKKRGFELLETEYINCDTKLKYKCLKCNSILYKRYDSLKLGSGCPSCSKRLKYKKEDVEKIYLENNLLFLEDIYKNRQTPNKCQCLICKNIIYKRLCHIQKNGHMCEHCKKEKISNKLKGEKNYM